MWVRGVPLLVAGAIEGGCKTTFVFEQYAYPHMLPLISKQLGGFLR